MTTATWGGKLPTITYAATLMGHAHPAGKEHPIMLQPSILFAQQQMPHVDSMYWIMLVSRILHILGAVILVGGLFYIRVVITSASRASGADSPDQFFGGRRASWAKWVGIATAILLITGFWNYVQTTKLDDLAASYHMIIGLKILAAIAVFLVAALLAGRTAAADAIRQNERLWLDVCLFLGILVVILAGVLRSFPHNPKADTAAPPKAVASSVTR
ncbi:MAG TPA: hypothetical protein VHE81_14220 [Lacipirellulaceae bacterium]|nr:hypothetical protein [Lacipirellulaceae bacterium]